MRTPGVRWSREENHQIALVLRERLGDRFDSIETMSSNELVPLIEAAQIEALPDTRHKNLAALCRMYEEGRRPTKERFALTPPAPPEKPTPQELTTEQFNQLLTELHNTVYASVRKALIDHELGGSLNATSHANDHLEH